MNAKQQGRLDGFFTATPNTSAPKKAAAKGKDVKGKGTKRKVSSPRRMT
jgi:flap endonuclease-1